MAGKDKMTLPEIYSSLKSFFIGLKKRMVCFFRGHRFETWTALRDDREEYSDCERCMATRFRLSAAGVRYFRENRGGGW